MQYEFAKRLQLIPPYLFRDIDLLRNKIRQQGIVDIIDLGIGDPDQPTPAHIIDSLYHSAQDSANHKYPSYSGLSCFREAVAKWYERRFRVKLDADKEIIALIGSKEGLAHFPLAFINPGDVVICPNPAYPVYYASIILAGGTPIFVPLLKQNGFLPNLEAISNDAIISRAKIIIINYPNNPTAAVANLDFYHQLLEFAYRYNLIVVSDAAYTEIAYTDVKPPSFFEVPGAKEVGIEFHSLSKTYNMTGWRLGFAVGNATLIAGLSKIKSQIDSGVFNAVQMAGVAAILEDQKYINNILSIYQERRDILVRCLQNLGLDLVYPQATFYIWSPCPVGLSSIDFSTKLLNDCGIISTPGCGFGVEGEGYVRFSLTIETSRLFEAADRLSQLKL